MACLLTTWQTAKHPTLRPVGHQPGVGVHACAIRSPFRRFEFDASQAHCLWPTRSPSPATDPHRLSGQTANVRTVTAQATGHLSTQPQTWTTLGIHATSSTRWRRVLCYSGGAL
jgi:hypothetical protein